MKDEKEAVILLVLKIFEGYLLKEETYFIKEIKEEKIWKVQKGIGFSKRGTVLIEDKVKEVVEDFFLS